MSLKAKLNGLNGWQRIWLVAAVLWLPIMVASITLPMFSSPYFRFANLLYLLKPSVLLWLLALWILPAVAVYVFGVAVAWVIRGLRDE